MKHYHYYLLDRNFYRVEVLNDRHTAEHHIGGHRYTEVDKSLVTAQGTRITWQAYVLGISNKIIANTRNN